MGVYLNPGNSGFKRIIKENYVDKTGLIGIINRSIGSTKNLICISRPRRFGKSYAAQMLCAYYDKSCDSKSLFDEYTISNDDTFADNLNKYHVISIDVTSFISEAKKEGFSLKEVPSNISEAIKNEVESIYPDIASANTLNDALVNLVNNTGTRIVFIIDEWDSMIREASNDDEAQQRYLNLLRGWFKNNNFTPQVVAAAYMTGILPIKKDGTQSAISDFREFSMLSPQEFASYVGFTEEEVKKLCDNKELEFDRIKKWYDGYTVGAKHSIYNPYSVMQALETGQYKSYWRKTSAAEALMTYIDMNQDGLQDTIARLIAGEQIEVDTESFQNDVETFSSKDDVLTLLIHLGYLTYEEIQDSYDVNSDVLTGLVKIPNDEVRFEFEKILRKAAHKDLIALVARSDKLLEDTLSGDSDAVAKAIEEVHETEYAPTFYNNEQSLRYIVKMAYISCVDQYAKIEELPSGHGIADLVYLPKRRSKLPAMLIELKWNHQASGAIEQIKNKNYPRVLENYGGEIVLVGVSYREKDKQHTCAIERIKK